MAFAKEKARIAEVAKKLNITLPDTDALTLLPVMEALTDRVLAIEAMFKKHEGTLLPAEFITFGTIVDGAFVPTLGCTIVPLKEGTSPETIAAARAGTAG